MVSTTRNNTLTFVNTGLGLDMIKDVVVLYVVEQTRIIVQNIDGEQDIDKYRGHHIQHGRTVR